MFVAIYVMRNMSWIFLQVAFVFCLYRLSLAVCLTRRASRVTLCALSYRRYDDSPRLVEKVCENMMDAHVMRLLQVRCCAVVVMLMTAAAVVVYSKCLLGNALNVMRRRPRRWICRIFMPPVQV